MSGHLGDRLTALVDGELDHAERDRVLSHLARCDECRAQAEAHRRLKAALGGLRAAPPLPSEALLARLTSLPRYEAEPLTRPPRTRRGAAGPGGPRRPGGHAGRRPRRAATAGVLLVVGLVGALALGGPASSGPAAVDPGSAALIADHVSTTSEVPLTEPAYATVGTYRGAPDPDR